MKSVKKKILHQTCLVVQWLTLAANIEGPGLIPGLGTKILHATALPHHLEYILMQRLLLKIRMGECFIIGQTIGTMGNFLDRHKNGFPLNHLSLYREGKEC